MFENLTDLSFQRTRKQAIGFYLVALLVGTVSTALAVIVYLAVTGSVPLPKSRDFAEGLRIGQEMGKGVVPFIVFLISTTLGILIIRAKKTYTSLTVGCVILAAVLSVIGALFSFIPVAYLTTLPKSTS